MAPAGTSVRPRVAHSLVSVPADGCVHIQVSQHPPPASAPPGEAACMKEGTACRQAAVLLPLQISLCWVRRALCATGL